MIHGRNGFLDILVGKVLVIMVFNQHLRSWCDNGETDLKVADESIPNQIYTVYLFIWVSVSNFLVKG